MRTGGSVAARTAGWLAALILLLAALAAPSALAAPPVVVSEGPAKVAVTLYRDPDRGTAPLNRARPGAFAVIAETRTVTLPPGEVVVRFEGVAGGIVPQTAILFGTDPRERNRDAALLSQGGLVDAFTGQAVILKRTDPATGKVTEEPATIRSAADRLVLSTPRGVEAVYCSGLTQMLIYPQAPATLSAKPVLSMTTKDQPGGTVTITLAYLATGFDWDATYVATLAEDGKSLALLSWLTMASGDETSFVDATTAAVAGRVNRSAETRDESGVQARNAARFLNRTAQCWPAETTTSNLPDRRLRDRNAALMMELMGETDLAAMEGDRPETRSFSLRMAGNAAVAVVAKSESLGDLKLYTIPVPVTVAARAQKQVAFLNTEKVRGTLLYRTKVSEVPGRLEMLFRFRNRKAEGLGNPLPAGGVLVFQVSAAGRRLVGQTTLADKTTDEEVELTFGNPASVTLTSTVLPDGPKVRRITARIANANPFPITVELDFPTGTGRVYSGLPARLTPKPGKRVLSVPLGPGSERMVSYRVADAADPSAD